MSHTFILNIKPMADLVFKTLFALDITLSLKTLMFMFSSQPAEIVR